MATWSSVSVDAFKAAEILRSRAARSAVNRAYFAAYATVAGVLAKDPSITFAQGRPNPGHGNLINYVQQSLPKQGYSQQLVNIVKRNLRNLYKDRIRADYVPTEDIDDGTVMNSMRRAAQIRNELGPTT